MKILVVDNYDSFTYILVQYLGELGAEPVVVRNDEVTVAEVAAGAHDALLISPGPGRPRQAGISVPVIARLSGRIPILGVCLGHQALVEAFGGDTITADRLMHGKTCEVVHDGSGLFQGLGSPTRCMRYHSLIADPDRIPDSIAVIARTTRGEREIMAVQHREHATYGVQFHPESIGTEYGKRMLANFLSLVGNT